MESFLTENSLILDSEAIQDEFKCSLCNELAVKPFRSPCLCVFCEKCVNERINDYPSSCLKCKAHDIIKRNVVVDYKLADDIKKIIIQCPFEECRSTCTFSKLLNHMVKCKNQRDIENDKFTNYDTKLNKIENEVKEGKEEFQNLIKDFITKKELNRLESQISKLSSNSNINNGTKNDFKFIFEHVSKIEHGQHRLSNLFSINNYYFRFKIEPATSIHGNSFDGTRFNVSLVLLQTTSNSGAFPIKNLFIFELLDEYDTSIENVNFNYEISEHRDDYKELKTVCKEFNDSRMTIQKDDSYDCIRLRLTLI